MANTPYGPVDSDVSPALLPLAAQQAVSVSTTVAASSGLPAGTTFPGAPSNGDIFIYTADATNGVKWAFQYDSSQPTDKWLFLGGPPLSAQVLAAETSATGASYGDMAGVGPAIILPLAGDYEIVFSAWLAGTVAGAATYVAPKLGSAATSDNDAAIVQVQTLKLFSAGATIVRTGLAASATIKLQYRSDSGNAEAGNRQLVIRPIRVSG